MLDLHQAFEGKTELFQKKSDQKGSQNRVSWDHSAEGEIKVFSPFSGIPENPSPKRVKPVQMSSTKITKISDGRANTHEPFETLGR